MVLSAEAKIFSVNEITLAVKHVLDDQFMDVWVEGEISNFKHHSSGHMYFTLKDKFAQLRCVMFRGENLHLSFTPRDGQVVQALGDVSLYQATGSIQLYVKNLKPGGLGDLYREFERLKAKLQAEGLFDAARKKPLPFLPTHIGIATSPTGAAIRDLIHVITRRFPNITISLIPVKVQGEGAAQDVAKAIKDFHEFPDRPEVLIIGRGGGSIEDLWAFNEELLARAIAASEIPIISAVGHEIDFTIADFVADVRAATPSAAAEIVVPNAEDIKATLDNLRDRALVNLKSYLKECRLRLASARMSQVFKPQKFFADYRQRLDAIRDLLTTRQQEDLTRLRRALKEARLILKNGLVLTRQHSHAALDLLVYRLQLVTLKPQRTALTLALAKLRGFDPKGILARGYSICERNKDAAIITSFKQVGLGHKITVILHEGRIVADVSERKFL